MKYRSVFAACTLVAGGLMMAPFTVSAEDDDEPRSSSDRSMTSEPGRAVQGGVSGQPGTSAQGVAASDKPMLEETRDFVVNAAKGNMGEQVLAETAQEKSSNEAVKNYAQKLVEHHRSANEKLKTIAEQTDIKWPSDLRAPHHEVAQNLKNLDGKEFDQKYVNQMVQDHEREIQKYESLSQTVGNKDIQNYINTTLPIMKAHLDEAKQLQERLSTAER